MTRLLPLLVALGAFVLVLRVLLGRYVDTRLAHIRSQLNGDVATSELKADIARMAEQRFKAGDQ